MSSSFPPPVVLTLTPDGDNAAEADDLNNPAETDVLNNPAETEPAEGVRQCAPVPDDLLDAFTRRLFSDDPPEWAAEVMKELRHLPLR